MMTLREVRGVVCSFLHQMFIADPPLAKLVHFQVIIFSIIMTYQLVITCNHILFLYFFKFLNTQILISNLCTCNILI
jgi:integrator complex subunit 2